MPDRSEFTRLTAGYRHELLVYCYRMLGSAEDAEDLVQEVYLRAWRAFDRFEGRSSARTWLYRIATRACLKALAHHSRRFLPSGLGTAGHPEEVAWVRPIPGPPPDATGGDPAAVVGARSSVRLAFVAALQHLPARQRAVLILRDVLAWPAAAVAEALDTSPAAVNSALQRARTQVARVTPAEEQLAEPDEPHRRALLDRYIAAFEAGDADALTPLLLDGMVWEMPPEPRWLRGRAAVSRFLASEVLGPPGAWRLVPTRANGQPALAAYLRSADGTYRAHAIQVLTLASGGIRRSVAYRDPSLFDLFGLPRRHGGKPPEPR